MRRGQPMPAQFTATLMPPMSLCACAIARVDSRFVGDIHFWKSAAAPSAFAAAWPAASFTSISVTFRAGADESLRDRVAQPGSAAGDDGAHLIQFHGFPLHANSIAARLRRLRSSARRRLR